MLHVFVMQTIPIEYHMTIAGIFCGGKYSFFSATNLFLQVLFSFLLHQHHSIIQVVTPIW